MTPPQRFLLVLALALGLVIVLAACSSNEPDTTPTPTPALPSEEKVLTLLYWQAPTLPFPYLSSGYKDRDAGAVTLEPLAAYDPDGNIVPRLAAEAPSTENGGISEDGLTVTWRLRDGLMWSDGSPLTAQDVVFTWRYCTAEGSGCLVQETFAAFTSVEAVGTREIVMTLRERGGNPLLAGTGFPILSAAQFADCMGPAALTCDEQNLAPLGSGPYRITEFVPNERAVYERNPHYRGEPAYFDRVLIRGSSDAESAARAVLVDGEADYAWNTQATPSTLAEMEAAGLGVLVTAFSGNVERIMVNQTNPDPALGDDRSEYLDGQNPHPFLSFAPIRQAMSLAIDRQRIVDDFYGAAGAPACNLVVAPRQFVSGANEGCLVQDIEGANALLDENGVIDTDGDGVREYNGVPLRITFQTSTNAVREGTFALIQDWWQKIGIESELITHDASIFFGGDPVEYAEQSLRRFFTDVQMYTTGPDIDPQIYLSSYLCDGIVSRENNWAEDNVARMCDANYDSLYDTLADAEPGDERASILKALNDHVVQQAYVIPLVNRGGVSAMVNTLVGVDPNGWDSELWNIAEWRRED